MANAESAGFADPAVGGDENLPLAFALGHQYAVEADVVDDHAVRQIVDRESDQVLVPVALYFEQRGLTVVPGATTISAGSRCTSSLGFGRQLDLAEVVDRLASPRLAVDRGLGRHRDLGQLLGRWLLGVGGGEQHAFGLAMSGLNRPAASRPGNPRAAPRCRPALRLRSRRSARRRA